MPKRPGSPVHTSGHGGKPSFRMRGMRKSHTTTGGIEYHSARLSLWVKKTHLRDTGIPLFLSHILYVYSLSFQLCPAPYISQRNESRAESVLYDMRLAEGGARLYRLKPARVLVLNTWGVGWTMMKRSFRGLISLIGRAATFLIESVLVDCG
jgi:hypothetical protein